MRRYRCVKCGTDWFTASLKEGTKCSNYQGDLEEQQDLFDLMCGCPKALDNKVDEIKENEH